MLMRRFPQMASTTPTKILCKPKEDYGLLQLALRYITMQISEWIKIQR